MSKDVDRAQVLKTSKVRTALKTDGSWIHKSKEENERTEGAAESGYIPGKNTSFVSSAAKKFDRSAASTDSTLNPTLKKIQWSPSKGDSVTTGNVKALAGELGKNKLDPTTVAENREAHAATALDHSQPAEAPAPIAVDVKPKETSGKATALAPAVGSTKQSQSSAPQPVPDTVSKPPNQSDDAQTKAPIGGNSVVAGAEKNKDPSAVTSEVTVGLKAEDPPVITEPVNATEPPANDADTQNTDPVKVPAQAAVGLKAVETVITKPAKEICKTFPPTQAVAKTPEVKTVPQNSVVPVSHVVSESAADTAVQSAEPNIKSAVAAEPLVKTTPEKVAESEAPPAENSLVEVSIKEAVAPVSVSGGGAAEDAPDQPIELSDALVEEPTTEQSVPEPVNDPNQAYSNRTDDTTSKEKFQKPNEELQSYYAGKKTRHGKAVCSFCDQAIDGNVKITFSDPPVTCHSQCLKCSVCAKELGDLLTPIYLHGQVFNCKNCFVKALKT